MKQAASASSRSLLQGMPLFAGLDDKALDMLADSSRIRRLTKGQILFSRGDPADAFYVVCTGSINLLLDSANGRELVINEMQAGDGFGELGLITGQPRSATAIAGCETEVLVVARRDFMALLGEQPTVVRGLLDTAAHRLSVASERESALAFLDAPARLARVLLELDRRASDEGYITISQEELGLRVGLARQTVAEFLGKWRRTGWIVTGRGKIVLLNRAALRRQAEERT